MVTFMYCLAAMAVIVAEPPAVIVLLAMMSLFISWYHWFFISDSVTKISVLNDTQILLESAQGRWIPVKVTCLYYSGLGQVVYCQEFASSRRAGFVRRLWTVVSILPATLTAVDNLRKERCQLQTQLADPVSGDNTVSCASGRRSGTSILK
ncbi:hypothetical protein GCM10011403_02700 [Pseudohongiella nitratireducens]|uniref:Uncharacterized protein n=2 Tax=Pseudohongiella nitratireducens TaxID=1768907 RepID=A0A917GKP6_9GAMM|nr:hypothetical protein GCM10011403_02700 [Pseudohongiella nitratireducens]